MALRATVTKLDVLDAFEEIKVCTVIVSMALSLRSFDTPDLERASPLRNMGRMAMFHPSPERFTEHRTVISASHRRAKRPIRYVSVGPERAELVVLDTFGA